MMFNRELEVENLMSKKFQLLLLPYILNLFDRLIIIQ